MTYWVEYSREAEKFIKKSRRNKRLFEEFKIANDKLSVKRENFYKELLRKLG